MRAPILYIPGMASGRPDWDLPCGLGVARLLQEVREWGVPARFCLFGTGLSPGGIERRDALVEARQTGRAIRNLTAAERSVETAAPIKQRLGST